MLMIGHFCERCSVSQKNSKIFKEVEEFSHRLGLTLKSTRHAGLEGQRIVTPNQ